MTTANDVPFTNLCSMPRKMIKMSPFPSFIFFFWVDFHFCIEDRAGSLTFKFQSRFYITLYNLEKHLVGLVTQAVMRACHLYITKWFLPPMAWQKNGAREDLYRGFVFYFYFGSDYYSVQFTDRRPFMQRLTFNPVVWIATLLASF